MPTYSYVTTIVGSTQGSAIGQFNTPRGIAVDSGGNLYVADTFNDRIIKIDGGGNITLVAGSQAGINGYVDGTGSDARFYGPSGVALDGNDNVYVADKDNNVIRKITPSGVVSTIAGSTTKISGSTDGIGTSARFYEPFSVAVDPTDTILYVADSGNNKIRKIILSTGAVSTFASGFNTPRGVTVDALGNVYVTDSDEYVIVKITPDGTKSTLAGKYNYYGYNDATGVNALFRTLYGLAVDGSGNIYVADKNNHKIRKITPTGVVTTIAGSSNGFLDNTEGATAQFNEPHGVTVNSNGTILWVADTLNHKIRKIEFKTCSEPNNNQYVSATCKQNSDTDLRNKTLSSTCTPGSTWLNGYVQGNSSSVGSAGSCQTCTGPLTTQYVSSACTVTTNTVLGTKPTCSSGSTWLHGYDQGTKALAGSPGSCQPCSEPTGIILESTTRQITTTTAFTNQPTGLLQSVSFTISLDLQIERESDSWRDVFQNVSGATYPINNNNTRKPGLVISGVDLGSDTRKIFFGYSTYPNTPPNDYNFFVGSGSFQFVPGQWFRCTCTVDGPNKTITMYINGVQTDTATTTSTLTLPTNAPAFTWFPYIDGNDAQYGQINVRKVRWWNKVLPSNQIPYLDALFVSGKCNLTTDTEFGNQPTCSNTQRVSGGSPGNKSTFGSAGTCQPCTTPGTNQYVSAMCTRGSDTGIASNALCTPTSTYLNGYVQGDINTTGNPGTCQPCSEPTGISLESSQLNIGTLASPRNFATQPTGLLPSVSFMISLDLQIEKEASSVRYIFQNVSSATWPINNQDKGKPLLYIDSNRKVYFRYSTYPNKPPNNYNLIVDSGSFQFVYGQWFRCTCTVDGPNKTITMYINGVQTDTATTTAPLTLPNTKTFVWRPQGVNTAEGYINVRKVRWWNKVLPSNQIPYLDALFVSGKCNLTTDTEFGNQPACSNTHWASGTVQGNKSTFGSPGTCQPCTTPGTTQYVSAMCTRGSDTDFGFSASCSGSTYLNGYVQGDIKTTGNPGTCQNCTQPTNPDEYVSGACTPTSDTRIDIATCGFGYWRSALVQGTSSTPGSRTCVQCSSPSSTQYVSGICTPTADTVFAAKTSCTPGTLREYVAGSYSVKGFAGYCSATASTVSLCPGGSYCPEGSSTAITCPVGYYCPVGISSPIPCPVGSYCVGGASSPTRCNTEGYYCPVLSSVQIQCSAGTYCPQGIGYQIPCPPYTYSAARQGACTCDASSASTGTPNGNVTFANGKCSVTCNASFEEYKGRCYSSTRPARIIYVMPDGSESDTFIVDSKISYSCPPCYTLTGGLCYFNSTCDNISCPPGYILDDNSFCKVCPPGKYTLGNECVTAEAGYAASTGNVFQCPAGTYSGQGSNQCTLCPVGTYSSVIGATNLSTCLQCEFGTYSDTAGVAQCKYCPYGTYNSSTRGAADVSSCQPCTTCNPGQYKPTQCTPTANSGGSCTTCTAGKYCDGTTQTDCPIGTITTANGQSSCSACPAGQYQDETGRTSCKTTCSAGSFLDGEISVGSGSSYTKCSFCPIGTYQDQPGQTSCKQCSPGSYYPIANTDETTMALLNLIDGEVIQQDEITITNSTQAFSYIPYVTTVAGSVDGYRDGSGTVAKFNNPRCIAVDSKGNLYVADTNNHRIRKITPNGDVSTFAGSSSGYINSNGTSAQFNGPRDIAIDSEDNLYIADTSNHRIRKITPSGDVTTFAGSGTAGSADGSGTSAQFNAPYGIGIDSSNNNLYVVDYGNHRIRKITPNGDVTTFAGSTEGYRNGYGTYAKFDNPMGIAVDSNGNLYVADSPNDSIRKITPNGHVSTFAGSVNGTAGYADGTGTSARFNGPRDIAIDPNGNLYVTDHYNNRIRKITPSGDVTTFAGSGTAGSADGSGTSAEFNAPYGIVVYPNGDLYVVEYVSRIRRIYNTNPPDVTPTYSMSMEIYINEYTSESRIVLQNSVNQSVFISGNNNLWTSPGSLCVNHDTVRVCSSNPLPIGIYSNVIFSVSNDDVSLYIGGVLQSSKNLVGFTWKENNNWVYGPGTSDGPVKLKNLFVFHQSIPDNYIEQLRVALNPTQGVTACSLCPVGTYNPSTGSIGQDDCLACPVGTYNPSTGRTGFGDCLACPVGQYTDITGQSGCSACPSHTYSSQTGASTCTPCPANTQFNGTSGTASTVCTACPVGSISTPGSACHAP